MTFNSGKNGIGMSIGYGNKYAVYTGSRTFELVKFGTGEQQTTFFNIARGEQYDF